MRIRKLLFGLTAVSMASGCVKLSDAGRQVRLGKSVPSATCRELGIVYGEGSGGGYTTATQKLESAQNDLRNQAANLGANYVVMDAATADLGGTALSGRALRCEEGTIATPVAGTVRTDDRPPEERIRVLDDLLQKKLISQEEYDTKRAAILSDL